MPLRAARNLVTSSATSLTLKCSTVCPVVHVTAKNMGCYSTVYYMRFAHGFVLHCLGYIKVPYDDVIKWKHFPRYWPFARGIHRSPVNAPHKGQWRAALMFSLICARINGWVNNREAGDERRYRTNYDVIIMDSWCWFTHISHHWQWGNRITDHKAVK